MNMMKKFLFGVLRDDTGATMVEYSILVAFIAAVCITVIGKLGRSVFGLFSGVPGF